MSTQMYRPTQLEIVNTLATPWEKWPHLRSRIQRAEGILSEFDLDYREGVGWLAVSQRDLRQSYPIDFDGCSCYDYLNRRAVAGGRTFCKHHIALLAYREIMADKLATIETPRSVGSVLRGITHHNAPVLAQDPDKAVLTGAVRGRLIWVYFRYDHKRDMRTFADPASLAEFAQWYEEKRDQLEEKQHAEESAAIDAQAAALALDEMPAALRHPRTPDQWRAYHNGEIWQEAAD